MCDLCGPFAFTFSGRVRYMFASFWNRNHTLRALQRVAKNFYAMLEAEKKVDSFYTFFLPYYNGRKGFFIESHFCFFFNFGAIQERAESALRAHSSSVRGDKTEDKVPEGVAAKTGKLQAFIKEEVIVSIYNVCVLLYVYFVKVNFITLILVVNKLVFFPGYIFMHSRDVL